MNEAKSTILIVEDDLDIADMLSAYFTVQGYAVRTVNWGEDGLRACQSAVPDLVILDIRLPDIDGFEVARRLRGDRRTQLIPIIFLTEKRERSDRLRGLELQADDYITKPFDIQELRLRVRNTLRRTQQGSLTNPVTGLPEGSLVDEALAQALQPPETCVMIASLKNINRFREVYGFVASDDLLRAVALMMRDTVCDPNLAPAGSTGRGDADPDLSQAGEANFLGHLTSVDFVIVTQPAHAQQLRERIRRRLEQSFDYFYSDQDREQGTFRDKRLGVQIHEISLRALPVRDLAHLKTELEQFCH